MCILLAEVAEAAARTLAELVGGVMDVSKSSKAETSPTAPAQSAGVTFFIGDSDAQEKQEASADDPAADSSAHTTSSEVVLKNSKMKDKSASHDDGADVTFDDRCSTDNDSSQTKEPCRISIGRASAPENASKYRRNSHNASAAASVAADQSDQQVEVRKGTMSTSSAAASAETSTKTGSTS